MCRAGCCENARRTLCIWIWTLVVSLEEYSLSSVEERLRNDLCFEATRQALDRGDQLQRVRGHRAFAAAMWSQRVRGLGVITERWRLCAFVVADL